MPPGARRLGLRIHKHKYDYDGGDVNILVDAAAGVAEAEGYEIGSTGTAVVGGFLTPVMAPQHDSNGRDLTWTIVQGSVDFAVGSIFGMGGDVVNRQNFQKGPDWYSCVQTQPILDRGDTPLLVKQAAHLEQTVATEGAIQASLRAISSDRALGDRLKKLLTSRAAHLADALRQTHAARGTFGAGGKTYLYGGVGGRDVRVCEVAHDDHRKRHKVWRDAVRESWEERYDDFPEAGSPQCLHLCKLI